jgi:hypothetical protein
MSGAKRLLEEQETQRSAGIDIALESKTLQYCEFHGDVFEGSADLTAAYKVGNAKFSRGQLRDTFATRLQMTDAIKAAVLDHPSDECPRCAKHRLED